MRNKRSLLIDSMTLACLRSRRQTIDGGLNVARKSSVYSLSLQIVASKDTTQFLQGVKSKLIMTFAYLDRVHISVDQNCNKIHEPAFFLE